jgi:hypothetical protein
MKWILKEPYKESMTQIIGSLNRQTRLTLSKLKPKLIKLEKTKKISCQTPMKSKGSLGNT